MKFIFSLLFVLFCICSTAQRIYTNQSVLSSGSWYKIAISQTGVYKIDVPFLNSLGINTSNLSSNSLKIYGNTGNMLGEACNDFKYDDLQENAIEVIDGGDGLFNGNDFLMFFGSGTDYWLKDSINKRFKHQKNLYSNEAYYFLNISPTNGKRIINAVNPSNFNISVNTYNERFSFEENTTNLINSGKEWVGIAFGNLPGLPLNKTFTVDIKNYITNQPIALISNVVARSGAATNFTVTANNGLVQQISIPAVSGGVLDEFVAQQNVISIYNANQNAQTITYNYQPSTGNAQAWLNYWEIHTRCNLSMTNQTQLLFRDWNSVANGNIASFNVTNVPNNLKVWDITNATNPFNQVGTFSNNNFLFNQNANALKEYIAFSTTNLLTPVGKGIVANQNLHNTVPTHLLIITTEFLFTEAQRLANYHITNDNIAVKVVTANTIYNEFSSGIPDATAIRDFIKMYFDKYNNAAIKLENVLLFGDASFDYLNRINNNTNLVPSWQSENSFNPLLSYVSDDYFGYLNDNDNINGNTINLLDVGIGRIPAKNIVEAKNYVDKIINYNSTKGLGPWRNQLTLIADDEDGNLHLNDAESISNTINNTGKSFIQDKIYLDAYKQISGTGGSRYPDVNNAINNKIFDGTLIWNYSGHGGNSRLADEAVLDVDMISNWQNENKLPLFITATCDFAPFDDPNVQSIGEQLVLQSKTGAIALMTTTRVVFAFSNRIINNNYLQIALQRNANGKYYTLGEANKLAKNYTTTNNGDIINNRKFTLLGDPAFTIGYPKFTVKTVKINDKNYTSTVDTIKAKNNIKIEGEVYSINQTLFSNFNGKVFVTIYDKKQSINTLANDATSVISSFNNNGNILFKGTATVNNGKFQINFIAPKDMQYAYGLGAINYYANTDSVDANGNDEIMIGGNGQNTLNDNVGPDIKAYLNDNKFVNGSITNESPILLVYLSDSSGINTSNIGVGHEITAVIDDDTRNTIVLNNYYIAESNSYKKGTIRYALPKLKPGLHNITIKAWDVLNNSNVYILQCKVGEDNKMVIDNVLNYPNPFTNKTTFWFEHNVPNQNLKVTITIYTITGNIVKQIKETINTVGNRSCDIKWDGKDEFGNNLAKGTYIYQLSVDNLNGQKLTKIQKLMKF